MTLAEAIELLRDHWSGDVRTDGRAVKVAVGGMTGDLTRAEWRYGDLVLIADRPDDGTPEESPEESLDGLALTPPPMAMKEFTVARSGQDG